MSDAESAGVVVRIVDDDAAIRDSLERLIRSLLDVDVECFDSGEAFLEHGNLDSPGCVVADALMPGLPGLELARELGRIRPTLPVVVLTAHADVPMMIEMLELKVFAFYEKPFQTDEFLGRISDAIETNRADRERDAVRQRLRSAIESLTEREREVLDHLVEGAAVKEIAATFGVSPQSVARHRSRVLRKFSVQSDVELVRLVLEAGHE